MQKNTKYGVVCSFRLPTTDVRALNKKAKALHLPNVRTGNQLLRKLALDLVHRRLWLSRKQWTWAVESPSRHNLLT